MKDKKIKIRLNEDGNIFAETIGMKGKECLQYIELLEELLDAESIDSEFTSEYYETEIQTFRQNNQLIKGE
ncbi:DUF2997 domain-containing protein [Metabacillus halosaccharovorans]|uniref:DUF2997 domain-containing protein n=1 Tax=Metabacillus halosaccharovorans TaxID=930124 RepID=UPI00204011B4|nr:DUF2997 domain-containing protein [Metabacillus halosaccharovorans]MCM3443102.1 DUF2997 domain-containing protein [Metabacillus halosaccharovorans]